MNGPALYLANVALAGFLFSLLGVVSTRFLRARPAPVRYGAGLACLLLVLISPLTAWTAQRLGLGFLRIGQAQKGGQQVAQAQAQLQDEPARPPQEMAASPSPGVAMAPSKSPGKGDRSAPVPIDEWIVFGLAGAWGIGLAAALAWMLRGAWAVRVLRRSAGRPADSRLEAAAGWAARILEMRNPPAVAVTDRLPTPLSLGVLRPVILFPRTLENGLETPALEGVILHEAAHVAHRDHAVGLLQRLAGAFFWWNPLIRLLSRELSATREEICDNYVIRAQGGGERYAKCLVDLAERTTQFHLLPTVAGLVHPRRNFEERVKGLLRKERSTMTRMNSAATALVACFALVAGCAGMGMHVTSGESNPSGEPKAGKQDYWPLREGSSWTYWASGSYYGEMDYCRVQVIEVMDAPVGPCYELKSDRDGYEYWASRSEGLYVYRPSVQGMFRQTHGIRGQVPRFIFPYAGKPGDSKEWTEHKSVQIEGGGRLPSEEETRIRVKAVVESLKDSVTVPAGTFDAARIKIAEESRFGVSEETFWFSPGVGLVRRVQVFKGAGGDTTRIRELAASEELDLEKRIVRLCAGMDSDSFAVRDQAVEELVRIGEPALPQLKKQLGSQSLEVRGRARAAVSAIRRELGKKCLKLVVAVDKKSYQPGEFIAATLKVVNTGSEPLTLMLDRVHSTKEAADRTAHAEDQIQDFDQSGLMPVHFGMTFKTPRGSEDGLRFESGEGPQRQGPPFDVVIRENHFIVVPGHGEQVLMGPVRFQTRTVGRHVGDPGRKIPLESGVYRGKGTYSFYGRDAGHGDRVIYEFKGAAKDLFDEAARVDLEAPPIEFEIVGVSK